jgi:hypothetical protein
VAAELLVHFQSTRAARTGCRGPERKRSCRMMPVARVLPPRLTPGPSGSSPNGSRRSCTGRTRRVPLDKGGALLRLGRADQAVAPLAEGVRQLDDSMVRDRQLYLTDWGRSARAARAAA